MVRTLASDFQGREQSGNHRAEHREAAGDRHREWLDAEVEPEGHDRLELPHRGQLAHYTVCQDEPDRRSEDCEQERLDEQLHDDPPPACTERVPHGDFVRSRGGSRQHEGADIPAGHSKE